MFLATIKGGEIVWPSMRASIAWRSWKADHEGATVVITEQKKGRSLSQNAYYWVFIEAISKEFGQPADEIHEWAKRKFLPPRFITVKGEEMKIPGSTRDLGKAEFTDYLDKISAETGVPLPDPQAAGYLPN